MDKTVTELHGMLQDVEESLKDKIKEVLMVKKGGGVNFKKIGQGSKVVKPPSASVEEKGKAPKVYMLDYALPPSLQPCISYLLEAIKWHSYYYCVVIIIKYEFCSIIKCKALIVEYWTW